MNRKDRVNELLAELDTWVLPLEGDERPAPVLVDTIPSSSKLMRELRREMETISNDINVSSETKEHVRSVLRGEAKLSSLLESGVFPIPSQDRIPAEMRDVIESVREGEIR